MKWREDACVEDSSVLRPDAESLLMGVLHLARIPGLRVL
jgi:hypothetical protein